MPAYQQMGGFSSGGAVLSGDSARSVFGQVMGLVACTIGLTALGAYITRNSVGGTGILFIFGMFGCVIGLNMAANRGHEQLAIGLLFGLGLLLGLGIGPIIDYYAHANPGAVYQAAGTTALATAALGTFGYTTRKDLSGIRRYGFWALLALIVFGMVLVFVAVPGGNIIYCVIGLVLFSAFTAADFQRLARSPKYGASAVPIAAMIFLDIFNMFLLLLSLFGGGGGRR
jgi:FtsH-binding integral membrane protein